MTSETPKPIIQLRGVTKSFGSVQALHGIDTEIREGEFFSLLGPSGCGKTTLLRMIAGFDDPTEGRIVIDGQQMKGIPANRRPTNMVFQSYAIFPHLSVADNVGYGLKRKKMSRAEIAAEVERAGDGQSGRLWPPRRARTVGRSAPARRAGPGDGDAAQGGVAGRTVVGAGQEAARTDAGRAAHTAAVDRHHLHPGHPRPGRSADHVRPHRGDVRRPYRPGRQPRRPVSHPVNKRVTSFIGAMDILQARAGARSEQGLEIEMPALGRITIPAAHVLAGLDPQALQTVGVRPEMLTLLFDDRDPAEKEITGEITNTSYYGDMTYCGVALPGGGDPVTISIRNTAGRSVVPVGSPVRVGWGTESIVLFK